MCLIAYVPSGASLPLENIKSAHLGNRDGIGIMSKESICKFLGKKALKKAIKTVSQLEEAKIEYAIHFRYKTHGDVILQNCHPFKAPNGRAYVMHNGVLGEYTAKATKEMSDTAVFVSEYLHSVPDDNNMEYWGDVARHIGWSNKLCIMTHDYKFVLVNGAAGTYRDKIWYSQTYSLPWPKRTYTTRPYSGDGYYHTARPRSNKWPYHVEECQCQTCYEESIRESGGTPTRQNWYEESRARRERAGGDTTTRVPTSIVSDSLRAALDRRHGIQDPRMLGGVRRSEPLRLVHDRPIQGSASERAAGATPLQSLASSIPGVAEDNQTPKSAETESRETSTAKHEDAQLDEALRQHLRRLDDDGGYAEIEMDISTRGSSALERAGDSKIEQADDGALLPGWSELNTGTME